MQITIFATRLENGAWKDWEHICDADDIDGVVDSANAKAKDRGRYRTPAFIDYLDGARYIFNVAHGTIENPRDGDTEVYGVVVDQIVIGKYEDLQRHFVLKTT
ncbi:MAG: hypothetical protein WCA10_17940 [Terracidiphilus sp.]